MASNQIDKFLSSCPTPENGCFASDPDALDAMLNFGGDSGIRTDLQRVASASTSAAEAGIALEDATYEPVKIEVDKPATPLTPYDTHKLGKDEPRRVMEDVDAGDEIGNLRRRIAKCAYACGATAVGCPLRTPPEAQQ